MKGDENYIVPDSVNCPAFVNYWQKFVKSEDAMIEQKPDSQSTVKSKG